MSLLNNKKKVIGNLGEKLAVNFLKKHKHKILSKNFYSRFGEVDIISLDKKTKELVFVEVKTRTSVNYSWPENAVNQNKKLKLAKTAKKYLQEHKIDIKTNYRFDIISIELNYGSRRAKITHFKYI